MDKQTRYFQEAGGNNYFKRNLAAQRAPRKIPRFHSSLVEIARNRSNVGRLAVLGGASGVEASALANDLPGWSVSNVDISEDAISFGRANHPKIEHVHASIGDPSLPDKLGKQDIVVAMAVLLWVGRGDLEQTFENIHRLLPIGGVLAIHDFFPPSPIKNEIRHDPGYFTYKEDYSHHFLASGAFKLLEKTVWEYEDDAYCWEDRLVGQAFLERIN